MDFRDIKLSVIDFILNESDSTYKRKVSDVEYLTRCPFCGDSISPSKGHFYMHIDVEDNTPMLYNCFKCGECGILNKSALETLGYDKDLDMLDEFIKSSSKSGIGNKYLNNNKMISFDFELPEIKDDSKIKYLSDRIGVDISKEDYSDLKIITSFKDFLIHNKINTITCTDWQAKMYEEKYIGFLSYGNSHILFRDVTNTVDEKYRWVKYPIKDESKENRIFYSIATTIDLTTTDEIVINLSEGVIDIVSEYYNINTKKENAMHIATCGKSYTPIIEYLVSIGFIGSNITLNIFSDNDATFNKTAKQPTDIKYFNKELVDIKKCFGKVNIYYNTKCKDIGVPRSNISLKKYQL